MSSNACCMSSAKGDIITPSISSFLKDVHAHLTCISCLQLHLNPIQLSLEPIFWARVQHLVLHLWDLRWPKKPKQIFEKGLEKQRKKVIYLYLSIYLTRQWRRSCSCGSSHQWWSHSRTQHSDSRQQASYCWSRGESLPGPQPSPPPLAASSHPAWTRCTCSSVLTSAPRTSVCSGLPQQLQMQNSPIFTTISKCTFISNILFTPKPWFCFPLTNHRLTWFILTIAAFFIVMLCKNLMKSVIKKESALQIQLFSHFCCSFPAKPWSCFLL